MDIVLIDARNATFRHGWTRAQLSNSAGKPTGAIFGILSCLIRLHKFHPKATFIFCWDGENTYKSWRHKLCSTYKANRNSPGKERPPEVTAILDQIPAIKRMLKILGFPQYEVEQLEADDLLGILATKLSKRKNVENVMIYSMDKDMHQLIGGKISVVKDLDKSANCAAFHAEDIEEKFGVGPDNWIKFRALTGDPSDGIKSAFPKVGKVRALKLLAEGLDPANKQPTTKLEKTYKDHWSKAHMNWVMSKIVTNPESKVLTEKNKLDLSQVMETLSTERGVTRRSINYFKKIGAKRFLQFCVKYELNYIIENLTLFYKLGR